MHSDDLEQESMTERLISSWLHFGLPVRQETPAEFLERCYSMSVREIRDLHKNREQENG